MKPYNLEFLKYGLQYKNVLTSDFWVIDIEKVYYQGRFYLKLYIALLCVEAHKLNELKYRVDFGAEQVAIKIFDFSKTDKYPNQDIVGCIIEMPQAYIGGEYQIRLMSVIYDNKFFDYSSSNSEFYTFSLMQEEVKKNDYIKKYLVSYKMFPNFSVDFWQCTCGKINDLSSQICPYCQADKEYTRTIFNNGLDEYFWSFYHANNEFSTDFSVSFADQYLKYRNIVVESYALEKSFIDSKFNLDALRKEHEQKFFVYQKEQEEAKLKEFIKKKKNRLRISVVLGITVFSLFMYFVGFKLLKYGYAYYQFSSGNYVESSEHFYSLDDFIDSKELAVESDFNIAISLYEKDPVEAISKLENLDKYNYAYIRDKYDELVYKFADSKFNEKEYEISIKYFDKILDYADSHAKVNLAHYDFALSLYSQGNGKYNDAFLHMDYAANNNFKDSKVIVSDWKYKYAKELAKEKKYTLAISVLDTIKSYKDSSALISEYNYQFGKVQMTSKNYLGAITSFTKVINYKDSKTQIKEANYQVASQYYKNMDYTNAYNYFTKIKGYRDATSKLYVCEDKLYPWYIEGLAISSYDDTYPASTSSYFSIYDTYNVVFKILGGPPSGSVDVKITWCHGDCSSWTYEGYYSSYTFSGGFYWTNPGYYTPRSSYTFKVYLKVRGTWKYMGEKTIYV